MALAINPQGPPTSGQRRLMQWIQEHHPDEWVQINGSNRMPCKGLHARGYLDMRTRFGRVEVRMTEDGRTYLRDSPARPDDYQGGILHRLV